MNTMLDCIPGRGVQGAVPNVYVLADIEARKSWYGCHNMLQYRSPTYLSTKAATIGNTESNGSSFYQSSMVLVPLLVYIALRSAEMLSFKKPTFGVSVPLFMQLAVRRRFRVSSRGNLRCAAVGTTKRCTRKQLTKVSKCKDRRKEMIRK